MRQKSITMLGTGHATVTKCYNTCFVIDDGDDRLMVDAGGGNGVLTQLEKAHIDLASIHHLYVTHAHTDHILGVIWVLRVIMQKSVAGKYEGELHVYGCDKVMQVIRTICDLILHKNFSKLVGKVVILHELADGDTFSVGNMQLQCFDILSNKEKQYGFTLRFADGQKLVCMGDEPCNEATLHYAQQADWMLCEAFCLYADRDVFKPYEKCHSTALDAGKIAAKLGVKNLLIYHTEDSDLAHRKVNYSAEVKQNYSGNVFVPNDLEQIEL